ncbi:MAG: hypothetical protein HQL23_09550 [Candidatus Omnitrophica bacterium]|nr:hypothetical protein [Candidatus Omnitrophota bacterium]
MKPASLIIPLGIAAYLLVLLAVLTGVLKHKYHLKWVQWNWHIWLGFATLLAATAHAGIIFYLHH